MASWFSPSPNPTVESETSASSTTPQISKARTDALARERDGIRAEREPEAGSWLDQRRLDQRRLDGREMDQRGLDQRGLDQRGLDHGLIVGLAIAAAAIVAGIGATGIGLGYFFQPAGALIVLGGTLGVTLISSPRAALVQAIGRLRALFRPAGWDDGKALIEEILELARTARTMGILGLEPRLNTMRNAFLRQVLALAMDVKNREEFRGALETMLRARERQGDADAKVLENAGGFAPTIGVLGTVVGLIDALRHFSDLASVSVSVGTAFVSTFYGLALANLMLLPAAHRIRGTAENEAQADELITEGVLGIYDQVHPTLLRDRLQGYLREAQPRVEAARAQSAGAGAQST